MIIIMRTRPQPLAPRDLRADCLPAFSASLPHSLHSLADGDGRGNILDRNPLSAAPRRPSLCLPRRSAWQIISPHSLTASSAAAAPGALCSPSTHLPAPPSRRPIFQGLQVQFSDGNREGGKEGRKRKGALALTRREARAGSPAAGPNGNPAR